MNGRELKQYRIEEAIGAGGMGVVYRAHDTRLSRDVALKVLPAGSLADENARKRFRKEALALSRFSHPHIASLLDFDSSEDGTDFLVMELVSGPSLDAMLKRGPLPEKEVVRLGSQIVRALVVAHEQGIVHRDLKPANVKLTPDGLVKVLDFGLARIAPVLGDDATTDTSSGIAAGTPPYMSPEQLLGRDVDARTDVYAAGVVLYEMATGRRPFGETSGPQLVAKILSEPMPPPREVNPGLSPVLEQVILKATDKDAGLRHQTARDLLVDLERLAAGTSDRARRSEALVAPSRRSGTWPRLGAAALALVAVVGAAAAWLLRPGEPRITATRSLVHADVSRMETDGVNVYYTTGESFQEEGAPTRLFAVPLGGGVPRPIPIPWSSDVKIWGLRSDPAELLVTHRRELWRVPLTQGAPSRFNGLPPIEVEDAVSGAAWSPRGDRLAWVEDGEAADFLWVGDGSGANPRRLAEGPMAGGWGPSLFLAGWHPSGEWIRYRTIGGPLTDVSVDGARRREIPLDLPSDAWVQSPAWTPDGAFFLQGSRRGMFAHRERGLLPWRPARLAPTFLGGPTHANQIRVTPDGRNVVAFIYRLAWEVVRLNRSTGVAEPLFRDGTRTGCLSFSPDGSRVAWVSEGVPGRLWISRPDGSERFPLGNTDAQPLLPPVWSPDGRRVAFMSPDLRIHIGSPAEGTVEPLPVDQPLHSQVDPCWSPDGRWLAHGLGGNDHQLARPDQFYLRRVDLGTRTITKLPGSEGLWDLKCARDGRMLARDRVAEGEHERTQGASLTRRIVYKVRDPRTGHWTPVTVDLPPGPRPSSDRIERGNLFHEYWSRDGRHVYAFQHPQRRVVRFTVPGGRLETVVEPRGFAQVSLWVGLDPEDTPLVHRDVTQREIVVMDWEAR